MVFFRYCQTWIVFHNWKHQYKLDSSVIFFSVYIQNDTHHDPNTEIHTKAALLGY